MIEVSLTDAPLIAGIVNTLRTVPGVQADVHPPPERSDRHDPDAQVNLVIADKAVTLLIDVKKTIFPRDARQMIWQSRARQAVYGESPLPFLAAESISPGAKELLRSEHVGYFDSGGSLFLPVPGAYLDIDRPPPKALEKSIRTLYAGRRAQVLHALLIHRPEWFGVTPLAQLSQVSPATASQVLTELERFDWLATRGKGPGKERQLREPGALLDAWASQLAILRHPALRRYYVPGTKSDDLAAPLNDAFAAHQALYAFSYEAAAQRFTPYLSHISQIRARVVFGAATDAGLAALGARPVSEGANLVLIEAKSPGDLLFRENLDGLWWASPIQIYLDLLQGEGRAKEMAAHFRKERIQF